MSCFRLIYVVFLRNMKSRRLFSYAGYERNISLVKTMRGVFAGVISRLNTGGSNSWVTPRAFFNDSCVKWMLERSEGDFLNSRLQSFIYFYTLPEKKCDLKKIFTIWRSRLMSFTEYSQVQFN